MATPDNMAIPEHAEDAESGDNYDFSYLPEPVWVKVMELLPLTDQYHVSVTCQALYTVFNHPSNWTSAKLFMAGGDHNFGMTKSFVPDRFRNIVEKFGHYFQRLTVQVSGHLVAMDAGLREVVKLLAKVSRLEQLTLEVGLPTSDFHLEGMRPVREDLGRILQLVSGATRLKRLEVLSWPMYPDLLKDPHLNLFEVMRDNPKLAGLDTLSLFWIKDRQWTERSPLLLSPPYTCGLVTHFQHLQHLALRSPMLSDPLLLTLAERPRAPLLTLRVLLQYAGGSTPQQIPDLQAASWRALRLKCPNLQVEVAAMSRVPDNVLDLFLTPELPLAAVTILRHARCSPALVRTLGERFPLSLASFLCYCDPTDCGPALLRLAETCVKIDRLVFHGNIHCSDLLTLARLRRHWNLFEFVEKSIDTEPQEEEFDEDTVIGRRADGDLVQVRVVRFHGQVSESERAEQLSALSAEVTRRMDFTWRPS